MISCCAFRWFGSNLVGANEKNPQRISVDTPPVFPSSPPRFAETLKMLTTEPFFTILLRSSGSLLRLRTMFVTTWGVLELKPRVSPFDADQAISLLHHDKRAVKFEHNRRVVPLKHL